MKRIRHRYDFNDSINLNLKLNDCIKRDPSLVLGTVDRDAGFILDQRQA
jgi:hypothetical protein